MNNKKMTQPHLKQAPLPFIGQKRMFLEHFKQILNENIEGEGEGWTIVDVFGGSGLLSHVAKRIKPKACVIYNDFDGYAERIKHIDETNCLRQQIYAVLGKQLEDRKLDKVTKAKVVEVIENFNGYKDVNCLASWLLFSGKIVGSLEELLKQEFYYGIRKSDYPQAEGYLDGIEVLKESFHQLMPKFKDNPKALLLLDPPYLCTRQESYAQAAYFDFVDFLHLIDLTRPPYLFFSSTKSEFIRFIHYMTTTKKENWQTFEGVKRIAINTSMSFRQKYEDNLVYKF